MKKEEILKMISDKSIWKPIIGTSGKYYISKYGDVVSLAQRPQIIKPFKSRKGYLDVKLYVCGEKINKRIHRLVAIHFIPNPYNLPVVHHIDGNKENNSANNLKWVTHKENVIESWKMGRTVTEETKRKLSVKRIGRKLTEETKRKISITRKLRGKNKHYEQNI